MPQAAHDDYMKARGHRTHLQRVGEGGRTGTRPDCIIPAKAVDQLDDVLDLSLQRKLAGNVPKEQTYNRQRISIEMKEDGWW